MQQKGAPRLIGIAVRFALAAQDLRSARRRIAIEQAMSSGSR
jgi:hypothetical protein